MEGILSCQWSVLSLAPIVGSHTLNSGETLVAEKNFSFNLSKSLSWAQENLRVTCESPAGSLAVTCEPLASCLHDLRVLASHLRYL